MDNLLFQKIWEDFDFYEIQVTAYNDNVKAQTELYVNKKSIISLSNDIRNLVKTPSNNFYWEIGSHDLSVESFFSLKKIAYDNLGHFQFEVNIGIQNDNNANYYSLFPISTEAGLLSQFGENILLLNNDNTFESCILIK